MSTKIPLSEFFDDRSKKIRREFGFDLEAGDLFSPTWEPPVDVVDAGADLIIEVDLPGVDRNDLEVSVENNVIKIRGERQPTAPSEFEGYHVQERGFGRFERVVELSADVDLGNARANYRTGILRVIIPKRVETIGQSHVAVDVRSEMDRNYQAYLYERNERSRSRPETLDLTPVMSPEITAFVVVLTRFAF